MLSPAEPILRAVLAASSEGIVLCTPDAVVSAWNGSAERLLGHAASETIGQPLARFLVTAASGKTASGAIRTEGVHKNGARVLLAVTRTAIAGADGETAALLITLRATSEPPAWDADRLSIALSAAQLGDWVWDARTDIVIFSPRAAEIFGIPAGPHMTWTAMRDLLHVDDRDSARLAVERAIEQRSDYAIEYRLINGGRERWIAASGRARYDEHGDVLGMLGMVQDITTDRLLVRVDDAVRSLGDPDDIIFTAARMLGQHLNVDRCAYAFTETDEDTFVLTGNYTNGVHSIVGRYRFQQFGSECLRSMRTGQPFVVTDVASDPRIDDVDRAAYAQAAIVAVVCVPIVKAGRLVASMAVHMRVPREWTAAEVTLVQQVASRCWESIERSKVESERAELLKAAEAANRAKDEFLAMLGHELRNPLAPIVTAVQLMKSRNDVATARERQVIERQVVHLTRLVDDLLDVARITEGKVSLKAELFELAAVVTDAIEVASPLFEERSHTLVLDVAATGLLVRGDADRLTQVVSNLLTNAGKYTAEGGRITVSAAVEGDDIVLHVSDTGVGIAADALPRIFDSFAQGRQTIERAQGGLGLGLTIVKSFVERHGGQVTAHSAGVGQGTLMTVRLPRAQPGVVALGPRGVPQQAGGASPPLGARVLIVDDNEDAAELLASALTARGCETHVVHDGPQALRIGALQQFDAALLDIGLPVMDGYELATRLRELPSFRDAVLIAVTGYGQDADRQRALAAGFHHHMIKPVDLQSILTKLPRVSSARSV